MNIWIKRLVWILIGGGLLFFAGDRIYEIQQKQAQPSAKKKQGGARVITVSVSRVRLGTLRDDLLLTGALKAKEEVDVTAKATGRVEKIYFEVGDRVEVGDLIAELEDDEQQQQVKRAVASIGVTRALSAQRAAERENARAELARAKSLLDEGLISPQDQASTKTRLAVADAQVEFAKAQTQQAEAELRELRIRLEQAKIYASISGFVAERYVDTGAVLGPSNPILKIVNLSTMITLTNVPERNLGRLAIGNLAKIEVDAIPGRTFRGRIARIAPVLDAATRTVLVEIDVPNSDNVLKAEMFVRIQLETGTTREAILIPREGLVYRGSQPGVYVIEDGRPVFRVIETGLTRGDDVEVLANLDPGVRIVGRGATLLEAGDRISIVESEPESAASRASAETSGAGAAGGDARGSGTTPAGAATGKAE